MDKITKKMVTNMVDHINIQLGRVNAGIVISVVFTTGLDDERRWCEIEHKHVSGATRMYVDTIKSHPFISEGMISTRECFLVLKGILATVLVLEEKGVLRL